MVSEGIRRELIRLCHSARTRRSDFSPTMPTHWAPQDVLNPATGEAFTPVGAWEFIVSLLEAGHEIEVIELDKPKGKKGYVMKVQGVGVEKIYIKLQLLSGIVMGRSFHISVPRGNLV